MKIGWIEQKNLFDYIYNKHHSNLQFEFNPIKNSSEEVAFKEYVLILQSWDEDEKANINVHIRLKEIPIGNRIFFAPSERIKPTKWWYAKQKEMLKTYIKVVKEYRDDVFLTNDSETGLQEYILNLPTNKKDIACYALVDLIEYPIYYSAKYDLFYTDNENIHSLVESTARRFNQTLKADFPLTYFNNLSSGGKIRLIPKTLGYLILTTRDANETLPITRITKGFEKYLYTKRNKEILQKDFYNTPFGAIRVNEIEGDFVKVSLIPKSIHGNVKLSKIHQIFIENKYKMQNQIGKRVLCKVSSRKVIISQELYRNVQDDVSIYLGKEIKIDDGEIKVVGDDQEEQFFLTYASDHRASFLFDDFLDMSSTPTFKILASAYQNKFFEIVYIMAELLKTNDRTSFFENIYQLETGNYKLD